jgi:hypothetical protein
VLDRRGLQQRMLLRALQRRWGMRRSAPRGCRHALPVQSVLRGQPQLRQRALRMKARALLGHGRCCRARCPRRVPRTRRMRPKSQRPSRSGRGLAASRTGGTSVPARRQRRRVWAAYTNKQLSTIEGSQPHDVFERFRSSRSGRLHGHRWLQREHGRGGQRRGGVPFRKLRRHLHRHRVHGEWRERRMR